MVSYSWTKTFACSHASFIEVSLLLTLAQPNVPILQQAFYVYSTIPILKKIGSEYLKVRIKWELKKRKAQRENSGEYTLFLNHYF